MYDKPIGYHKTLVFTGHEGVNWGDIKSSIKYNMK